MEAKKILVHCCLVAVIFLIIFTNNWDGSGFQTVLISNTELHNMAEAHILITMHREIHLIITTSPSPPLRKKYKQHRKNGLYTKRSSIQQMLCVKLKTQMLNMVLKS